MSAPDPPGSARPKPAGALSADRVGLGRIGGDDQLLSVDPGPTGRRAEFHPGLFTAGTGGANGGGFARGRQRSAIPPFESRLAQVRLAATDYQ